jgi:hypothetical protein
VSGFLVGSIASFAALALSGLWVVLAVLLCIRNTTLVAHQRRLRESVDVALAEAKRVSALTASNVLTFERLRAENAKERAELARLNRQLCEKLQGRPIPEMHFHDSQQEPGPL